MRAEVISIGDEISSGQRLDTNSQWISQRLGEIGIPVGFHTTVADDLESNVAVFRIAAQRADVVVCTGGLGPTADDLTREAIATAFDRPLAEDAEVLAHIAAMFRRRGREMPERNRVQALFPAGSRVIPNPHGTAPGIDLELPAAPGNRACRIFALPGVPAELFEMWAQTVGPALGGSGAGKVIRHQRVKCFGVGESHLEQMLPDLIRRGRIPSVGITVHEATITLRITAEGPTPEACLESMGPTLTTIHECLGQLVFGTEDDELEHSVGRLLTARKLTLATAEGGPGGVIAHWLTEAPDAASWYRGGVVAASDAALTGLCGVPADVLARTGPISAEVARQMAQSCRTQLGADYGLAITAFPSDEPSGNQTAAAPPKVYLALAHAAGVDALGVDYAGHPAILKSLSAKRALNLLRLKLSDAT